MIVTLIILFIAWIVYNEMNKRFDTKQVDESRKMSPKNIFTISNLTMNNIFHSALTEQDAKRLFLVASESADVLIESEPKLPRLGLCEAIMFNTNIILQEAKSLSLDNWQMIEDDYLILLMVMIQREKPQKNTDQIVDFINERLLFYLKELNKLTFTQNYSPMWVYSTFYLAPLEDEPKVCLDIFEIMSFQLKLIQMINNIDSNLHKFFPC